jgi:hypothetical protein
MVVPILFRLRDAKTVTDQVRRNMRRGDCLEASRRVFGLVNHAHPAAAELLDDAVMRNGLTDHGWGNAMAEACASQ